MFWTFRKILDIFTSHFVRTSDVRKFFDTRMCERNVKLKNWQAEFHRWKFWKVVQYCNQENVPRGDFRLDFLEICWEFWKT